MSQIRRTFQDIDIRELIQHYKQKICLWDIHHPSYKDRIGKQHAWVEISNYFNKDVEEVKRKIKYLRSAYVSEKRKVEASLKSRDDIPYKPNLFYYTELIFLADIVGPPKIERILRRRNEEYENTQISQDSEEEEEEEEMISFPNRDEDESFKEPELNCKTEINFEPEPELIPPTQVTSKIPHSRMDISRAIKRRDSEESEVQQVFIPNVPVKKKRNLYMSFGNTLSLQLQQMPKDVATMTMSEIHKILTDKTLEDIRGQQPQCESSDSDYNFNELIEEASNDEM